MSDDKLSIATTGAARLTVNDAGNVGIGTTGPTQLLHVYKSQDTATEINIENPSTGTSAAARFRLTNNVSSVQFDYYNSNHSLFPRTFLIANNDNNGNLGFYVGGTNRLYILSSGNVGIGTESPNANAILDVVSTTKAFMPPRVTTVQKATIATPTAGMVVYDSTLNKLSVYTGAAWETVTSAP